MRHRNAPRRRKLGVYAIIANAVIADHLHIGQPIQQFVGNSCPTICQQEAHGPRVQGQPWLQLNLGQIRDVKMRLKPCGHVRGHIRNDKKFRHLTPPRWKDRGTQMQRCRSLFSALHSCSLHISHQSTALLSQELNRYGRNPGMSRFGGTILPTEIAFAREIDCRKS